MSFWPTPFTIYQTENWIKTNTQRYKEYGFGRWGLYLKDNNELIGDCGIMITEIDKKLENNLGYIIDHKYWNNGYATEAAEACKKYGFEVLKLDRLCANMAYNYTISEKVAFKIGMNKEKEFKNNKNRDILTYLYSINKTI